MSKILHAFQQHEKSIKRIFARYCRRREDIEDYTQETFIKAFAAEAKTDIQNPKAFLFRVAKNLALSELKRKVNTNTDHLEDSGGAEVLTDERQVSIENQIDGQRKLVVASKVIASLPEHHRQALLMRKMDRLKFKQIATRLNVSLSTVEKRVATALVLCNTRLREEGYDPAEFGSVLSSGLSAGLSTELSDGLSAELTADANNVREHSSPDVGKSEHKSEQ
ncbi:RNA polymerase sigma factor [Porticoccaceae bacterium]|nr:RNA polymerase sigma factor [Porticoccaceae bacterium]